MGGRSNRRRILKATAVGLIGGLVPALRAQAPRKKAALTAEDRKTVDAIREQAKKAGLGAFEVKSTEHFLGVGDGPDAYQSRALQLCEEIGRDFLAHFRNRGFKLEYPQRRLTVVTLKNGTSYRALSGDDPDATDGGRYYIDDDRLVIFDFRADQVRGIAEAKRTNTFALAHETIHLLCYDTGLVHREADPPAAVGEGLATYGEMWTPPRAPSAFGGINGPRLTALAHELDSGGAWIPIGRLMTDDDVFAKPETAQCAYAEAWLLVHHLMQTETRPRFQAYVAGLPRLDAVKAMPRNEYAESKLGPLRVLDEAVRRHAQRLARKARIRLPVALIPARD